MTNLPRTEFAQALKALTTEKGLDADIIIEAIKAAIAAAYRRDAKASRHGCRRHDGVPLHLHRAQRFSLTPKKKRRKEKM